MNLYGKKVILRAIEKSDNQLIREMFNDTEMEKLVVGWSFPLSELAQERWIENHCLDNDLRLIIELSDTREAIGIATLTDIDWKNRKAFHGMKISSGKNRHRGIGTDTVMAIMRYAFDELQLNRLDGSWFQDNIPSKNMYMKCGWKEEGVRRNYIYKGGKYRDLVETGILAEEYYRLVEANHYWDD